MLVRRRGPLPARFHRACRRRARSPLSGLVGPVDEAPNRILDATAQLPIGVATAGRPPVPEPEVTRNGGPGVVSPPSLTTPGQAGSPPTGGAPGLIPPCRWWGVGGCRRPFVKVRGEQIENIIRKTI